MSEITVASTTDTQLAVELAAGLNPGGAEGEESPAQPAAVELTDEGNTEQVTSDREETSLEEENREEPGDREPGAGSLRRARENRRPGAGNRKSERAQARAAVPHKVGSDKNPDIADGDVTRANFNDTRPTPAQHRSYEEFVEALADWKAGQRLQQQRQAEIAQAEQARAQEVFETYNEAAKSARARYSDFEKVVGRRDLKIPQAAQLAIIESGSIGPDIAYYLGKHPEVCTELAQMSPSRAVARIGQIEAEVIGNRPQATGQSGGSNGQAATGGGTRARVTLPAPITPVGGSSSRSSVPLGELPYRDYKRLRDQEERASRAF